MSAETRTRLGAWLRLAMAGLALLLLALLTLDDLLAYRRANVGIESGWSRRAPLVQHPRYMINTDLQGCERSVIDAQLSAIRATGVDTVRQRFAWDILEPRQGAWDWSWSDALVASAETHDLHIIAILDAAPDWARPEWEQANRWAPPTDVADYQRFCRAVAERYQGRLFAYQVWDQPNIHPHWGQGAIDPGRYVDLLTAANQAIRAADAQATIVCGALAPNIEWSGRNMSDRRFLQEIYRLKAQDAFDVVACKAYGFWSGPDDRRLGDDVLNLSRTIRLRREMLRHGDRETPLWAVEAGWCALPIDWQGDPAPLGSDTPNLQAQRLSRALERIRQEWPWMGLVAVGIWQPNAEANDPTWGYSLTTPEGEPSTLLEAITPALLQGASPNLDAGRYSLTENRHPLWDRNNAFSFRGTSLAVWVHGATSDGEVTATIDGRAYTSRYRADQGAARLILARNLPLGQHFCTMHTPDDAPTITLIQVGAHRPWLDMALPLATALLVSTLLLRAAIRAAQHSGWREAWTWCRGQTSRLPETIQIGVVVLGYALTMGAPWGGVRLLGLLVYGAGALFRPDVALLTAIWSIPFAPVRVRLGPGSFGPAEISVLVAAVASGWQWLAQATRSRPRPRFGHGWHLLDWTVLALVTVSMATCFWAEYQREALRELRVVILEPALLYLLLRRPPEACARNVLWVKTLVASGIAVALYALLLYPTAAGVIEAEGVRRARAFYGSPNNLALVLERLIPMALALGLWGRTSRQRWGCLVGAGLMTLALLLSFSRGAILIGLPIGLGLLLWLKGGRTRWVIAIIAIIGGVALIPLLRTERFASLLDLSSGTAFVRTNLWLSSLEMVRDHPLLGLGLDQFLYYYGDYAYEGALVDRWLNHPHNIVLDFWLRLGLAGLGVLIAMGIAYVRAFRQGLRRAGAEQRALVLGLAVAVVAALAHGVIDAGFFVVELAYWMLLAGALLVNVARRSTCAEHGTES